MAKPSIFKTVYFRDGFTDFSQANLSIASSPVLYGLSIYSVFSVFYNQKDKRLYAFRLRDHYDRLVNSARVMDFDSFEQDWPWPKFEKTMKELIHLNEVKENVLVRVSVFIDEELAGTRMHGLKNSLSAFIYPLKPLLPPSGVHLGISSWQRTADNAIPPAAKISGSYVNASLMKNEALLNSFDDAIALDGQGHIAEATVSNIMMVKDGVLITPEAATDTLEGITCLSLLEMAPSLGLKHLRRSVDRSELYTMDEAFLCGSSLRISPILSVDKRPIGSGKSGAVTAKIIKAYDDVQYGFIKDFAQWRTPV